MFKPIYIYIKIKRDWVNVTNLETGETVSKSAINSFSTIRNIVSNFNNASATIESAIKDLKLKKSLMSTKILIHQLEGIEGGLSDIEKRALRDIAELVGANKVLIAEQSAPIPIHLALENLKNI